MKQIVLPGRGDLPSYAVQLADDLRIAPDEKGISPSGIALEIAAAEKVRILVHADGFVIFDFTHNPSYCGGAVPTVYAGTIDQKVQAAEKKRLALAYLRTRYMTAFLSTLWAGAQEATFGMPVQRSVHPGNVLYAVPRNGKWVFQCSTAMDIRLTDPRRRAPVAAFANAARIFDGIYAAFGAKCFELLSLMNMAADYHREHEFASCLLLSWTVAEAVQGLMWKQRQAKVDKEKGGHTKFNKERRERLNGRDFTASIVSEVLSLSGDISDARYAALNQARSARNKFAHELKPVTAEQATQALNLAAALIKDFSGSSYRVSASYGYHI